jgi:PhnB protein
MSVPPRPEHLTTVTPRLVVPDAKAALAFYAEAFGAQEVGHRFEMGGVVIHMEVRIGDAVVMLTDDGADPEAPARSPESLGGVSAIMATYWDDVDAVWERALGAGAEVVYPLEDQFYGDRGGRLRDPFGHQWMLSRVIERVSPEEVERRARELYGGG